MVHIKTSSVEICVNRYSIAIIAKILIPIGNISSIKVGLFFDWMKFLVSLTIKRTQATNDTIKPKNVGSKKKSKKRIKNNRPSFSNHLEWNDR